MVSGSGHPFHQPGEWQAHEATFLAWPSAADLWLESLAPAQEEFVALSEIIADYDRSSKKCLGDDLYILVSDAKARRDAERSLAHLSPRFFEIPYGDIWLRDIAPIFLVGPAGERKSAVFGFNGWGNKYVLPHDDAVASRIAAQLPHAVRRSPFVLEGGSVEVDGEGTVLTTRQCLENPNRNPGLSTSQIERELEQGLGAKKVLWLDDGLLNDHTDGHIDTLARFVRPGVVVCMRPADDHDPNQIVLLATEGALMAMTDAAGRRLEVHTVPSPGSVRNEEGAIMPASYVNFYIANTTVVVPQYGVENDQAAVAALASLFPERRVVGASARAILGGGGAFHCITQQLPRGGRP
jgi:agmatine deiminase